MSHKDLIGGTEYVGDNKALYVGIRFRSDGTHTTKVWVRSCLGYRKRGTTRGMVLK